MKKKKTRYVWLIAAIICLVIAIVAFAAVKKASAKAAEMEAAVNAGSMVASLPNPMKSVTREDQVQSGLVLDAPEKSENVSWFLIETGTDYPMSEVRFTYQGTDYYYRARPTGSLELEDISGLWYEWTEKTEGKVLYCDAEVKSCDKAACVNWLDIVPGVVYSIGTTGEKPDAGKLLELANLVFSPTQGEA